MSVRGIAGDEGGFMERRRSVRHSCARGLVAAALLALAADASGEGDDVDAAGIAIPGEYRHSAVSPAGQTRHSVARIARRGAGFSVAWEEDAGNLFGGIGIGLDGIFGAAYTEALNGAFRGSGVVAYRIDGGTLDGVRLPYKAGDGQLIAETLQGPANLEGDFIIVRSQDAAGRTDLAGHIEIERRGDTYQMTWHTPDLSYEGVGVRVGDVLIAGYAHGFAPGVIAYCTDGALLSGVATYGHAGVVGADRMMRHGASAEPSERCRAAIDRWNPSLVRG